MKAKIIIVVGVIAGTFVLALAVLGVVLSLDCDPPKDDHLVYSYVLVPAEENGYDKFCKAGELAMADVEELQRLNNEDWDSQKAKELIARHGDTLKLWRDAMKIPKLQGPEIKAFADEIPYLVKWRNLARLISIQARLYAENGQLDQALSLAVDIVEFGTRQESSDGTMINYLVANAVKNIGLVRILQIIQDHEIPTQLLTEASHRLRPFASDRDACQNTYRVEYMTTKTLISELDSGKMDPNAVGANPKLGTSFTFKKNKTTTLFADAYSTLVENCTLAYHDRKEVRIEGKKKSYQQILTGNFVGEILFGMIMPALSRIPEKMDRTDTRLSVTRLFLAIKGYGNDHDGALPTTLKELVPAYIEALPVDLFSKLDESLRYSAKKGIVYTVGPDGVDDSGMDLDDFASLSSPYWTWKDKDPSFLIDTSVIPAKPAKKANETAPSLNFFGK